MMLCLKRTLVLCTIAVLSPSCIAQIYKCKDANDKLIFSDKPCQFNKGAVAVANSGAATMEGSTTKTTKVSAALPTENPELAVPSPAEEVNYLPHSITLKMRDLVQKENYRDLNVQLQLYQAGATALPEDEDELFTAYTAFQDEPAEYRKILDRWVHATPEAYQPYLARAFHSFGLAWAARGEKWASETTSSQIDSMNRYFSEARKDIEAALEHGAPPLVPSYLNLGMWKTTASGDSSAPKVMKRAQNKDLTEFSNQLDHALRTSPASYYIRAQAMRSLYPRWGGSYEAMAQLAQQSQHYANINPRLKWLEGFVQGDIAFNAMNDGQYKLADELYNAALSHGDNPAVLLNRAKNSYKQGNYNDALRYLDQSISASPEVSDAYQWRCATYRKFQEFDEALADNNRALLLDPTDEDNLKQRENLATDFYNLGTQFIKSMDYTNAVKHFETAIELQPTNQLAYYSKAWVLNKVGKYDLALEDAKRSIELNPSHYDSYVLLDRILMENSDWDQIIRYWNAYIAINPNNPDAYFERFGTNLHKGNQEASIKDLKKASDLGHVKARQKYAELLSRSVN
jgi:tetratricopeptide (TPR) repeat protein